MTRINGGKLLVQRAGRLVVVMDESTGEEIALRVEDANDVAWWIMVFAAQIRAEAGS